MSHGRQRRKQRARVKRGACTSSCPSRNSLMGSVKEMLAGLHHTGFRSRRDYSASSAWRERLNT